MPESVHVCGKKPAERARLAGIIFGAGAFLGGVALFAWAVFPLLFAFVGDAGPLTKFAGFDRGVALSSLVLIAGGGGMVLHFVKKKC